MASREPAGAPPASDRLTPREAALVAEAVVRAVRFLLEFGCVAVANGRDAPPYTDDLPIEIGASGERALEDLTTPRARVAHDGPDDADAES